MILLPARRLANNFLTYYKRLGTWQKGFGKIVSLNKTKGFKEYK